MTMEPPPLTMSPLPRKSALTYEHPATLLCSERLTPTEAARLERCRTLLFVITDTSRAPAHMTMAAHYIGKGASVVLCIQMLPDNCVIQGEKVSIGTCNALKNCKYQWGCTKSLRFPGVTAALKVVVQGISNFLLPPGWYL